MIVRAANPEDAAEIAAIWNEMIANSLATFTTQQKQVEEVSDLITNRSDAFWIVEDGGVQGFATFGAFRAGPGYSGTIEHTVILAAAAQGQGKGRALMAAVERAAIAQGKHIMVAGISSANPTAVEFHFRLGFVQTGHLPQVGRKAEQWLDLILMQKTISMP